MPGTQEATEAALAATEAGLGATEAGLGATEAVMEGALEDTPAAAVAMEAAAVTAVL